MLRYRWLLVFALLFATLSAGGLGAGIIGIKPVLDNILSDTPKGLPELAAGLNTKLASYGVRIPDSIIASLPPKPFDAVAWIVVGLGVLTIFGAVCNFLHAYLSLTIISRTVANIRRETFRRVIHLPLKSVLSVGPSDLVSRIVYDSTQLGSGFNALLSRAIAQITKGVAAFAAAMYFNWFLTIIAAVVGVVVGVIIQKLGKKIRRASKKALAGQANLYQSAAEVVGGLRVVKAYSAERYEAGRFHATNKEVVRQEFKVRTARALASPLVEMIAILVLGALALVGVKAILDGHLDKSTTLAVLGALGLAAAQLKPLTGLINDIQQAGAAANRLDQIASLEPEPGHGARLPKLPRPAHAIAFENVTLTYEGAASPAVRDVSLTIPHGQTVAFVGPNGCGKTSLLSLLPRLFDPTSGRVLIDGRDIREVSIRSLRRHMGVVTQDTVLFRGTLRANIAYGAETLTNDDITSAARRARAQDFILAKPDGFEFRVGEQGSGLSGGQRQRISIARAIVRDPAVLILDEATSMVDAESEARIAEAISEFVTGESRTVGERRGRTCLIVAHRLSTVVAADRIVVMDQGRIVDQGTHAELLSRCEIYQSLVSNQLVPITTPITTPARATMGQSV